jgi:hypothetical protein
MEMEIRSREESKWRRLKVERSGDEGDWKLKREGVKIWSKEEWWKMGWRVEWRQSEGDGE